MNFTSKVIVTSVTAFILCSGIGAVNGISQNLTLTKKPLEYSPDSISQIAFADKLTMSLSNLNYTTFQKDIQEPEDAETIIDKHLQGKLSGMADSFIRYGMEYEVDPVLLAAIAIHETGNGSSKAIVNQKNAGGIMADANRGILKQFISVNSSIEYMAWLLRNSYFEGRNLRTIEELGNVYCPVGANNDSKTNVNQHWIPSVKEYYKQIAGVDYE